MTFECSYQFHSVFTKTFHFLRGYINLYCATLVFVCRCVLLSFSYGYTTFEPTLIFTLSVFTFPDLTKAFLKGLFAFPASSSSLILTRHANPSLSNPLPDVSKASTIHPLHIDISLFLALSRSFCSCSSKPLIPLHFPPSASSGLCLYVSNLRLPLLPARSPEDNSLLLLLRPGSPLESGPCDDGRGKGNIRDGSREKMG